MNPVVPAVNLKLQYDCLRSEMEEAIRRVLERQSFILGPEVKELEQAVAEKQNCAHAVGCASGSDALLLSLLALGIGPGDEVLAPPFTFFATGGAVARLGARPRFVDIDSRTFNISPQLVADALRKGGKPAKAMIPVHLYGQCADMGPLLDLAKEHGLSIVEDAAQAILARYQQRSAGSMGNCGCFSFFPTKNLGGIGDAGMITTNDGDLAGRLRTLRVHGAVKKYVHAQLGINSRLDTVQAAALLVKLRHLEEWTRLKQRAAALYRQAFQGRGLSSNPDAIYPTQSEPVVLPYVAPGCEHVYHQFTLRVHRRDELAQHLAGKGIESVVYYPLPLHLQPAFSYLGYRPGDCPESERAAAEVLSIPIFPEITEEQQSQVVEAIAGFYGR